MPEPAMSLVARLPRRKFNAPRISDLPTPVVPVKMFKPSSNCMVIWLIKAKFEIVSSFNIIRIITIIFSLFTRK